MVTRRLTGPTREKVRYLLGGCYNTISGYGVFAAIYLLLHRHMHYLIILALAQVVNVVSAYMVYRWFVFRVTGNVISDALRFSVVYVLTFFANVLVLPLLVDLGDMTPLVAQAIVVVGVALVGYLAHKHFSFRRPLDVSARA